MDTPQSGKTPATFANLPADIHIAIAEQVEPKDLPQLCSITKWMLKTCAHVLYRDVDLSVHNRGVVEVEHDFYTTEIWSDNSACTIHNEKLEQKQVSFIQALMKHPEYAVHVRRLSWSILGLSVEEQNRACLETTWKIFGMLTNARHVDLSWAQGHDKIYMPNGAPKSAFFSTATSVRLVGMMGNPFTVHLLKSVTLSTLRHLNISNVQECGEQTWAKDPARFDPDLLNGSYRPPKAPGAMVDVLTRLTGRCTSLKTLTLVKVARGCEHAFDNVFFKKDIEVYEEYAALIRSVSPTLEELIFEQGPPAYYSTPEDAHICRDHATRWEGVSSQLKLVILAEQDAGKAMGEFPPRSGGTYRPMDLAFAQTILPALLEPAWPCLKDVKMIGIGAWDHDWAVLAEEQLAAALNENVTIHVCHESRTFELAGLNDSMKP